MARSIAAVFVGLVVLTLLTFSVEALTTPWLLRMFPHSLPTNVAMHANVPVKLFILCYSTLAMVAAGYVTAWIARAHAQRHALVMAAIQIALTLWAMSIYREHAPLWAWLAGIVLMLPAASIGAALRSRFTGQRSAR